MLALAYPKGERHTWGIYLKPLHVSQPHRMSISFEEQIPLDNFEGRRNITRSEIKSDIHVAAFVTKALPSRGNSIVLAYSPTACWSLSAKLAKNSPDKTSDNLSLVKEYVEMECGGDFTLCSLLEKGIGVHHAGIPPEVRSLMEWLTEEGELFALVATTTIAQGVNFPISNLILSTYSKPQRVGTGFIKRDKT